MDRDGHMPSKHPARSRSGTSSVSLWAWGVLTVLAGLRFEGSFAYVSSLAALLLAFGLLVALFALWISSVVMMWADRKFSWGPIATLVVSALIAFNPAGDSIHASGFQLARPGLEAAVASGDCPTWAGPYRIKRCYSGNGSSYFVLADSGGFVSIDELVKPADPTDFKPDGWSTAEGDGWYFVSTTF